MRICMNTALSGSGRVDDIEGHQQGKICGLTKLVKSTEDVRRYAKENAIDESTAINLLHGKRFPKKSTPGWSQAERSRIRRERQRTMHLVKSSSEKVGNEIAARLVT